MTTPTLSVVMPAYQLGDDIADNIRRVARVLPQAEIVVVDDGSTDQTEAAALLAAAELPQVKVLRHQKNQGKGEALRTGAESAGGDWVIFLDGDLDLPPEQVPELLGSLEGCDVLVGSKHGAMHGEHYPWKRRVLSLIFAVIIRMMFRLPISETQTGLKILRAQVVREIFPKLTVHGYAYDLEMLVRAQRAGYRLAETPVRLRVGASSGSLRPAMLWELGRDTLKVFLLSRRRLN
jgi:glycosyltransferase involved in cell wall biosynthesis